MSDSTDNPETHDVRILFAVEVVFVPNLVCHPVANLIQKRLDGCERSIREYLDAAIGQVTHPPPHRMSPSNRRRSRSKADALDSPGEIDQFRHVRLPRVRLAI